MPRKPSWFTDNTVLISNAPTCGINKDGIEQYAVDPLTGERSQSRINDKLLEDAKLIRKGELSSGHLATVPIERLRASRVLVPQYYDFSSIKALEGVVSNLRGFKAVSLGDLVEQGLVELTGGHGSPSSDQRVGDVPYIKVSDLRAGHVNINPTNMIPLELAKEFWGGDDSGLRAYDLVSPERASKNIGEFCVLMPGQERVVFTKEVIIIRTTERATFDQFFLMWALTLSAVREQWKRVILMQTNREDVGDRSLEIQIPYTEKSDAALLVSKSFREYYKKLEEARKNFDAALKTAPFKHHFFLT